MSDKITAKNEVDKGEGAMNNFSGNPEFIDILEKSYSRRQMLQGSLGVAIAGMLGASGVASAMVEDEDVSDENSVAARQRRPFIKNPVLGFDAIPVTRSDTVTVPKGYRVQAFIPWGTPILGNYPAYKADGSNTGLDQEQQVGSHHDGMHYFPIDYKAGGYSSKEGLLCVNHEYIDPDVINPNGMTIVDKKRANADEVRKEIAAHGVSIVHIKLNETTKNWEVVPGSRFNRRITAETLMEIRGPVRGHDLVKTQFSPSGTRTRGTINNCAHGYTPWGTYLTCEENWPEYFFCPDPQPREHSRQGVSKVPTLDAGRYGWETVSGDADRNQRYSRFDATPKGADATKDYRNEPNCFGWVVEIDPFTPGSLPKKRTALGRFRHEGCWLSPPQLNQPIVYYSGDDARNEYIYKFVSKGVYTENATGDLLDEGTLYAAKFNEDGTGVWLPLDINHPDFKAAMAAKNVTFKDQAEVLVNARLAADIMGATKMDRPEWGTVHPQTREVFMTMTNNTRTSTTDPGTRAVNPRFPNPNGHIVQWREANNKPWATSFTWEIFMFCGLAKDGGQILPDHNGPKLTADNICASPDGLWFDDNGILWIQTDMSGNQQGSGPFGNNQMLAANPWTGEVKRFLVGPMDQEVTGVVTTPDGKYMFVNMQHPGDRSTPGKFTSNWPDSGNVFSTPGNVPPLNINPNGPRPRSATIVISREDGGVIGL